MKKKILIIDDDADLSGQLAEILRDEGHAVETRLFTRESLDTLRPEDHDLIILDLKMPDISGVDVLNVIREKQAAVKVFVISGRPFLDKVLKEAGVRDLVAGIISKPFPILSLIDTVNNA